jgi:signal transduction histidine kinase
MPQAPIDSEVPRIQFDWLVRLRWWATGVETLAIVAVDQGLEADLPLAPLAALVALGLLTNVAAQWWRRHRPEVGERAIGNLLALDVLLLTGVLALTGGPFNPFSFLYLVHISLAAVLLGTRWTWGIAGLSILCSAALFLTLLGPDSGWFDEDNLHMRHMRMHLYGMWVAAAVAAVFIVYFVSRIRTSLLQREGELATARLKALQAEKFVSLATLAGGAAHELATPLSTIAVVSKELERSLAERAEDAENLDDVGVVHPKHHHLGGTDGQASVRARAKLRGDTLARAGTEPGAFRTPSGHHQDDPTAFMVSVAAAQCRASRSASGTARWALAGRTGSPDRQNSPTPPARRAGTRSRPPRPSRPCPASGSTPRWSGQSRRCGGR